MSKINKKRALKIKAMDEKNTSLQAALIDSQSKVQQLEDQRAMLSNKLIIAGQEMILCCSNLKKLKLSSSTCEKSCCLAHLKRKTVLESWKWPFQNWIQLRLPSIGWIPDLWSSLKFWGVKSLHPQKQVSNMFKGHPHQKTRVSQFLSKDQLWQLCLLSIIMLHTRILVKSLKDMCQNPTSSPYVTSVGSKST